MRRRLVKILANVLFDESHANAWSIRPGLPERMNPANPGDASYQQAAALLRHRGHDVTPQVEGLLTDGACSPATTCWCSRTRPTRPWERTTSLGSRCCAPTRSTPSSGCVRAGGGLVVLGECDQDKYGNNLNELLARFGVRILTTTVQDLHNHKGVATWVLADLVPHPVLATEDVLAGVRQALLLPGRRHRGGRRPGARPYVHDRRPCRPAARRHRRAGQGPGRGVRRLRPVRRRLDRRLPARRAVGQHDRVGGRRAHRRPAP